MSPKLFDQDAPAFTDPWALERWPSMRRRLSYVGATDQEIAEFEAQWLHDRDWPFEDKTRVWALGDAQLRVELVHAREVNRENLETDADAAQRVARRRSTVDEAALREEALEMSAWEPHSIVEWIGNNADRARAMLTVEEDHPRPRAELIAALLRVIA